MKYVFLTIAILLIGCKKPTPEEIKEYKEKNQNKMKPLIENYFIKKNETTYFSEFESVRTKDPMYDGMVVERYTYSNDGYIVKVECNQYRCGNWNTLNTVDIKGWMEGSGVKECRQCGKPLTLPLEEDYTKEENLQKGFSTPMLSFKWEKEKAEDEMETRLRAIVTYVKHVLVYDHSARIDMSSKFDVEALIKGTNRKRHELGLYRIRNSYLCTMEIEWKDENLVPGAPREELIKTWKQLKPLETRPPEEKKPEEKKEPEKKPEESKEPEKKLQ
jgi:hypothetical protein